MEDAGAKARPSALRFGSHDLIYSRKETYRWQTIRFAARSVAEDF